MWVKEEPHQFSMGQTAPNLACSFMEKPLTGLDDCLNMLLSCFRKKDGRRESGEQRQRDCGVTQRVKLICSANLAVTLYSSAQMLF